MAIMSKGPGKGQKKQEMPKSKIGTNKEGQTVAASGYKMAITPKKGEPSTKTLTVGSTSAKMPNGIFAPQPTGPGKKVAAPVKKKTGLTAAGKVVRNVKEAMTSSGGSKPFISTRQKISRSKKTGKSCY